MTSYNRIIIAGNITRDPEMKATPGGTLFAKMTVAVSDRYKDKMTGQTKEKTSFIPVTVWRDQAKNCERYLHKGDPVLVEGKLDILQYEKDGQNKTSVSVNATAIQFLSSPRAQEKPDGRGAEPEEPRLTEDQLPF